MTSIRAILYDFDGTIVNSEKVNFQCWKDCMQLVGVTLTEEEYLLEYIGHPMLDNIERVIQTYNLEVEVEDMVANGQQWYAERPEAKIFHFMPHALESIQFYHDLGVRLAIVTGSQRHSIDRFFQQYPNMHNYFEFAVTATDVERSKPDPMSYQLALKQLDLPAEQVVAFEDTWSGTTSAKGAGIRCYAIQQAAALRAQLDIADGVFRNLKAAKEYLVTHQLISASQIHQ
jgi:HAD superfamily hydrolase (TIGR01509 family)